MGTLCLRFRTSVNLRTYVDLECLFDRPLSLQTLSKCISTVDSGTLTGLPSRSYYYLHQVPLFSFISIFIVTSYGSFLSVPHLTLSPISPQYHQFRIPSNSTSYCSLSFSFDISDPDFRKVT